jgi:hypothetical protein
MLPNVPSEGRLIRMGGHSESGGNGKGKRKRGEGFPGLNPEQAAANGDGAVGRRAAKARRSDAELAAELASPDAKPRKPRGRRQADRSDQGAATDAGRATGLFALAIAIASLFVWPLPLGLTAAVLGWYSFRERARGLGVWSAIIGLTAALSQLVLIPIYAALT